MLQTREIEQLQEKLTTETTKRENWQKLYDEVIVEIDEQTSAYAEEKQRLIGMCTRG